MGTKHYPVRMFSDGMDDFVIDKKTMKMAPGVASLQCCNYNNVEKIYQLLLQNRHLSLTMLAEEVNTGKDTVRKIVVEDLFTLCSTLFDSRAEGPENCSLTRFYCHSRQ